MKRRIFEPEHDMFRQTARRFYEKECSPHMAEWERNGVTARGPWLRAGELGPIGWEAPEKFGGQRRRPPAPSCRPLRCSGEIVDRCLQLRGGYGYMNEYETARLWRDARVQRLYGGTSEIMRDLVGRSLGH